MKQLLNNEFQIKNDCTKTSKLRPERETPEDEATREDDLGANKSTSSWANHVTTPTIASVTFLTTLAVSCTNDDV